MRIKNDPFPSGDTDKYRIYRNKLTALIRLIKKTTITSKLFDIKLDRERLSSFPQNHARRKKKKNYAN